MNRLEKVWVHLVAGALAADVPVPEAVGRAEKAMEYYFKRFDSHGNWLSVVKVVPPKGNEPE